MDSAGFISRAHPCVAVKGLTNQNICANIRLRIREKGLMTITHNVDKCRTRESNRAASVDARVLQENRNRFQEFMPERKKAQAVNK
jgi:hypothetical protein